MNTDEPGAADDATTQAVEKMPLNLETAVGMNRETREPREKKGLERKESGLKHFTQRVNAALFRTHSAFAYFAYFAVSIAEFRLNGRRLSLSQRERAGVRENVLPTWGLKNVRTAQVT